MLEERRSAHGKLDRFEEVAWIKDRKQAERWVAFDELFLRRAHEAAGLRIEEMIYGQWPGRKTRGVGFGKKDAIVAVRH